MDLFYKGKHVKARDKGIKDLLSLRNFLFISTILGVVLFVSSKNSKRVNYSHIESSSIVFNLDELKNIYTPINEILVYNVGEVVQEITRENIFIGDSRMLGMLNSGSIDENQTFYGVGYGYSWFVGNGTFNCNKTNAVNGVLSELLSKIEDDKRYNIIIWLGVNDYRYHTAKVYFEEFVKLALEELSNQKMYIVSVGPVDDNRATTVNNEQINNFNDNMKNLIDEINLDNLKYIDLEFDQYSINRYDSSGLHYGSKDYINIYNFIEEQVNENTKSLNLR